MTFVPPPVPFRIVSLEISLKPFTDATPVTRERVCRTLFQQWLTLCRHASEVHVMLWIADGSELLDYRGNLDDAFEWARYIGGVSHWQLGTGDKPISAGDDRDAQGIGFHGDDLDPDGVGLHRRSYLYRDEPAVFTYRWLRDLVADLKRIGGEITGRPVKVVETFDPGPEFANSPFKYERHREICLGGKIYGQTFVGCAAVLHADDVAYAGFPDGIPEGTSLGTFLGRQINALCSDIGFEAVWFSNGFGFGLETWGFNGATFDGTDYHPEQQAEAKQGILRFWSDFRKECPELLVRTRGTNFTAGVDLASDAVPLREIFEQYGPVQPPVNSPWAALDGDFGLELAGWMSHTACHPGDSFPFRFYTHDPWWMNSPWLDRYQRMPHDIYLPLAVSRLNGEGVTVIADTLAFLSNDDSRGGMPEQVPADVTSHILRARENPPDAPGPLVWVYPADAYHEETFGENPDLPLVNFGDWYIRGLINIGIPLNTVVSDRDLLADPDRLIPTLEGRMLLLPVPAPGSRMHDLLDRLLGAGCDVILYGPLPDDAWAQRFGLTDGPPAEGDLALDSGETIHHAPVLSAGPLTQVRGSIPDRVRHLAEASKDGTVYPLAVLEEKTGQGRLAWLRGTVTCNETISGGPLPAPLPPDRIAPAETLAHRVLGALGLRVEHHREDVHDRIPLHTLHQNRNGLFFSGYNPEEVENVRFRHPLGAPAMTAMFARLDGGDAVYRMPAWWHAECRCFVQQDAASRIYVRELPSIMKGVTRRLLIRGLDRAVVRFLPETGTRDTLRILADPRFPYQVGEFLEPAERRVNGLDVLEIGPVSGTVLFSW